MEASSGSRRRRRASRGRVEVILSSAYNNKPRGISVIKDPEEKRKIKAAMETAAAAAASGDNFVPFPYRLAKMQLELESLGESSKLIISPCIQKLVDEAREAMLANTPNPHATSTGEHTEPIATLVENLNLEAASSATGTRAKANVGSILKNCLGKSRDETMVENLKSAG